MHRRASLNENVGVRIFKEENSNYDRRPPLSPSLSSNFKTREEDKTEVEPETSAQQVLDCLDWQINLLNETRRIVECRHEERNCKRDFIATNEPPIATAAVLAAEAQLKYWSRRNSDIDSSNRLRKLALDRYLKQTLKSAGECGCHFEHNNHSNENSLGDRGNSGLGNNQFGKFELHSASSSRQNYYLAEENSHLIASETYPSRDGTLLPANSRTLVDPPFQSQEQNLPKLKPTTSAKQLSHGLLIEESGEDCASGVVAAAGRGGGKPPAVGKPQATGRSQSAYRQGLSGAADLQFYGNKSANFKPSLISQRSLVTCKTNRSGSSDCTINEAIGYEWDYEEELELEVGSALAGLHDDNHDDDISENEGIVGEENYTRSASVLRKVIPPQACQRQTYCSLTDSSTHSLSWAQDNPPSDSEYHLNSNLKSFDTATKSCSRRTRLERAPQQGSSILWRSYLCNKRTDSKLIVEPNDDDERSPTAASISSSNLKLGHYDCNYSLDGLPTTSSLSMNETLDIAVDAGNSNFTNSRGSNYKAKFTSLSVEQQQGERGNYIHHLHCHSNGSGKLTGKKKRIRKRSTPIALASRFSSESVSELVSNSSLLQTSSDNDEEYTLIGGKRKRRNQSIGKAEKSMKAVKDIAKLSVPSLSSLQYLPSHLDVCTKKNLHKKRRKEREINNRSYNMAPKIASRKINSKNSMDVVADAESRENINLENQGLLTLLCMSCNCATKASDLQQNEKTEQDASKKRRKSKKSASELQLNENNGSDSASSHKSPSKSEKLRPSSNSVSAEVSPSKSESTRAQKSQAIADKQQFNKPIEKQSPSFFNILKSSSIAQKLESQASGRVEFLISRRANEDEDLEGELDLDLTSGSSRNYSNESRSNNSLTPGPQSSSVERHRLQQRQRQQSSTSYDSSPPTPDDLSSQPSRPQSVCSDQESAKARKGSTLRMYLTPTKFFSTSPSSKSGLSSYHDANLDKRRISSPTSELRKGISESFFTRSLNRFSGRKKQQKKQLATTVKDNLTIKTNCQDHSTLSSDSHLKNHSSCTSPNISTLSSHNDSLRSLDDIELPLFPQVPQQKNSSCGKPVLLAPEIVFSRVEYSTTLSNRSESYTRQHMGRSKSNHQRNLSNLEPDGHSNHSNDVDYDYLGNHGHHLPRYGSDFGIGDLSINDGASERALSLPSSPHRARRQRPPGASSRSPRLTHSPVPFQSPINQSTKIEDGLKVCSSEHFEKHIGNIKGGQLDAQKKLFKAWINHYSPHLIQHDLVDELRDGIKLIGLLASLTRDKKLLIQYDKLNRDKQSLINRLAVTPTSRLRHLSNVSIAIEYLRKQIGMKLINLNPMDVVSGRPNVILGLCWNIILHFQLEQNFLRNLDSCDTSSLSSYIENGRARGSTSRLSASSTNEDSVVITKSQYKENDEELGESSLTLPVLDGDLQTTSQTNSFGNIEKDVYFNQNGEIQPKKVNLVTKAQKGHNLEEESKSVSQQHQHIMCDSKPLVSWSLLNWLFASDSDTKSIVTKQTKSTKRTRRLAKSQKSRASKSPSASPTFKRAQLSTSDKSSKEADKSDDSEAIPFARMFWNKLIKASKASMPLNIVLLICLAGICVVPLINKDACCELSQPLISTDKFSMHEKPT